MSNSDNRQRRARFGATLRQEEQVTPLELFFDLVFVLALTQCTALMAETPTWLGLLKGIFVLGVLWWAWVGYTWLTSVINPEEGVVRLAFFGAMAALLVAALCVPGAFDQYSLLFVVAYAFVRAMHIALFLLASRDDAGLRRSTWGLALSSALGVGLLGVAAALDGTMVLVFWALAMVVDTAGPVISGAEGWKVSPKHFAERHGLIIIIALGESIVAIGAGSVVGIDLGVVVAAVLGMVIAAALWWLYFDVVAIVAERHLSEAEEGLEQNEIARDSYSYLHFPMVVGIVLIALGLKKTIAHVDDPLKIVVSTALLGGTAIYLFAHIAFRWRNIKTLNKQRFACALVLLGLIPLGAQLPAIATLAVLSGVLITLIAYEAIRFAERRDEIRHG